MFFTKKCLFFFSLNAFLFSLLTFHLARLFGFSAHFLLRTVHYQFCTSMFTYICLFLPSIFIVNCLHNPWAYFNLSLNVFHFPFVSSHSIDLLYLIFLHYSKIHLTAVPYSYFFFPFWLSLCPNYQLN